MCFTSHIAYLQILVVFYTVIPVTTNKCDRPGKEDTNLVLHTALSVDRIRKVLGVVSSSKTLNILDLQEYF